MEITNDIEKNIDTVKNLNMNNELNMVLEKSKNLFQESISKTLDKAARYVIKAMPIPDAAKDILMDIKDSLKTGNVKTILSTAVNSCLREGLELLGIDEKQIKSIGKLKKTIEKGGMSLGVKNVIDIVENKYLKNNLVEDYVKDFFKNLKQYVLSHDFNTSLNETIEYFNKEKDNFISTAKEWYMAYDNMNIDDMVKIAQKLGDKKILINSFDECFKENSVIQNMTQMVNNQKLKLTDFQKQLCQCVSNL